MLAFGPIPSRRLGQSLGINNIPRKACSYDCVYCQVGPTTHPGIERRAFYPPEEIFRAVKEKLDQASRAGAQVDYLSFVPDGEPTLDIHLGREIELLKPFHKKIAVFTNGTLLWQPEVRAELAGADWVSVKADAVLEDVWRKINRPFSQLSLPTILDGMRTFSRERSSELATETMLVQGINDTESSLQAVASFLAEIQPDIAYIGIPTRPPNEPWVHSPDEKILYLAYRIFTSCVAKVEFLIGFSEGPFQLTGDIEQDLLGITAVHPMREQEAFSLVKQAGAERTLLEKLIAEGQLIRVMHEEQPFYIRKVPKAINK